MKLNKQINSRVYRQRKKRRDNIERGYVPLAEGFNGHNRLPGWKSLACAVLEQAVSDYFILVRNGYVKKMKRTGKRFEDHGVSEKTHCQYIYADDITNLLKFINDSCKFYVSWALYEKEFKKFDHRMIRKGILQMEAAGNIG